MVGLWGRKKDEKKDEPVPPPPAAPAPAAAAGDMFGGLAAKTRRKKGAAAPVDTPEPSETASHHETASHTDEVETRAAPFFAKFEMSEQEDAETAHTRRRLERFYEEYNPSKLSQIDQTLASYAGKENELFAALVQKYGPEPAELVVPSSTAAAEEAAPALDAGWGAAVTSAGDDDGGWGSAAGGGFATDFGAPATAVGGGFEFSAVTDDSAAAAGGFQFGGGEDTVATTSHFGITEETAVAQGGFGFAVDVAQTGFQDAGQPWGTTVEPVAAAPQNASSDDDDDDDEPTLNERHSKEMSDAQATVDDGSTAIANTLTSVTRSISTRQNLVRTYATIESDIEDCIQREDFEAADTLNQKLEEVAASISAIDAEEPALIAKLPVHIRTWLASMSDMAETYVRHREELVSTIGDEEQKTERYIAETSSRLDNAQEKIVASLERANRMLHNAEQEVINIEQRHAKIQEKIHEQTRGLKEKRSVIASDKEKLDAEIRELEALLQQKRRQSADKKIQLAEIDEKLTIIMDDHAETVGEVERQMQEEKVKRADAQNVVDDLSNQETQLQREQREFDEQREDMRRIISNSKERIAQYLSRANGLRDEAEIVKKYLEKSVRDALSARTKNRGLLLASPHQQGAADAASPMATVHQLEHQLQNVTKEIQELKATESSYILRVQEIKKSLPLLEAAKKAAAQAKQFKDAQAKTEEIRSLTEECTNCAKFVDEAAEKSANLHRHVQQLTEQIAKERSVASAKMLTLVQDYKNSLLDSVDSASSAPEYVPDGILEALNALLRTLTKEVSDLVGDAPRGEADTTNKQAVAAVEVDSQPEPVAPTTAESVAEEAAEDAPEKSVEELQEELSGLEADMAEAMEVENFLKCDEIQEKIDAIQAILSARGN